MHALPATQIIDNPVIGTMLLVGVAIAMVTHSLRYKVESLTGLAFGCIFAALALTDGLFAKTQKEAQSYLGPMIVLVILPTSLGVLPGMELTAATALVPLLNLSLVCKEMLSGVWHWNYIALIFGSTGTMNFNEADYVMVNTQGMLRDMATRMTKSGVRIEIVQRPKP